jgi:hypothetical protein
MMLSQPFRGCLKVVSATGPAVTGMCQLSQLSQPFFYVRSSRRSVPCQQVTVGHTCEIRVARLAQLAHPSDGATFRAAGETTEPTFESGRAGARLRRPYGPGGPGSPDAAKSLPEAASVPVTGAVPGMGSAPAAAVPEANSGGSRPEPPELADFLALSGALFVARYCYERPAGPEFGGLSRTAALNRLACVATAHLTQVRRAVAPINSTPLPTGCGHAALRIGGSL